MQAVPPCTVPGDGMHCSSGHACYRNELAVLEIGNSAKSRDPNSPAIVLKEGPISSFYNPFTCRIPLRISIRIVRPFGALHQSAGCEQQRRPEWRPQSNLSNRRPTLRPTRPEASILTQSPLSSRRGQGWFYAAGIVQDPPLRVRGTEPLRTLVRFSCNQVDSL